MSDNHEQKKLNRFLASEYAGPKMSVSDKTVSGGICPQCGQPKLWGYTAALNKIMCARGKCPWEKNIYDLFPDLKVNFDQDFKATEKDPNRPATEYLLSRRIPAWHLKGLEYRYLPNCRGSGSGAVLFTVGPDPAGKKMENGRIFSPSHGVDKGHNIGSTTGQYWRHNAYEYDGSKPVWFTEGIIDALSLMAMGRQAMAVLASGQDPAKIDLSDFPHKVIAFDNDDAGRAGARKWHRFYPEAEVILCDQGTDWNDLLCQSFRQVKK